MNNLNKNKIIDIPFFLFVFTNLLSITALWFHCLSAYVCVYVCVSAEWLRIDIRWSVEKFSWYNLYHRIKCYSIFHIVGLTYTFKSGEKSAHILTPVASWKTLKYRRNCIIFAHIFRVRWLDEHDAKSAYCAISPGIAHHLFHQNSVYEKKKRIEWS